MPAILYGTHADVWKRCRRALKRFLAGEQSLLDVLEADGMTDTADHPGLIVVTGPSPATAKWAHFQCYVPLRILRTGIAGSLGSPGPDRTEIVRSALLERAWGVLCLLDSNNMNGYFPDDGHPYYCQYLRSVLLYWDALDGEGERYSCGMNCGSSLWEAAIPVLQALARIGVPQHVLTGSAFGPSPPLPEGGLPVLIAQADPALASDLIDFAATFSARKQRESERAAWTRSAYRYEPPQSKPLITLSEPMKAAMRADDADAVERLIEHGEPVDGLNTDTMDGPLHWAARRGHMALVQFLLDHGAAIEATGEDGQTPLQDAAFEGQAGAVRLLLDRGANPYHITHRGLDLLAYAEMGRNPEVSAMLQPYWAGKDPEFHFKEYYEQHPGE
jgi:hypothetical protein